MRTFVNSVMSYTKMDVPTVELFETAVTFDEQHRDPLSAHQCLTKTFGKKAGVSFVFRADTARQGATGCTPPIPGSSRQQRRSALSLRRE